MKVSSNKSCGTKSRGRQKKHILRSNTRMTTQGKQSQYEIWNVNSSAHIVIVIVVVQICHYRDLSHERRLGLEKYPTTLDQKLFSQVVGNYLWKLFMYFWRMWKMCLKQIFLWNYICAWYLQLGLETFWPRKCLLWKHCKGQLAIGVFK